MVISKITESDRVNFENFLKDADCHLNKQDQPALYESWDEVLGEKYEHELLNTFKVLSEGTALEGKFQLISGRNFPDIVAWIHDNQGFGVEAKTTKENKWNTVGSSIMESTRVAGMEKIYLSFAKLGGDRAFKTRLYEECLSGVAVTHSPRYQINMNLAEDANIFAKVGVSYNEILKSPKPFEPFKNYYAGDRAEDSYTWWAGESSNEGSESASPPILRMFSNLDTIERTSLEQQIYFLFPEVIQNRGSNKYNRAALWLVKEKSIVHHCIRDSFSASGNQPDVHFKLQSLIPRAVDKLCKILFREDFPVFFEELGLRDFNKDVWLSETLCHFKSYENTTNTLTPEFLSAFRERANAVLDGVGDIESQKIGSSHATHDDLRSQKILP